MTPNYGVSSCETWTNDAQCLEKRYCYKNYYLWLLSCDVSHDLKIHLTYERNLCKNYTYFFFSEMSSSFRFEP